MKQKEREQLADIKRVLDEGFDRDKMKHSDASVIDAHQRINLLVEESAVKS